MSGALDLYRRCGEPEPVVCPTVFRCEDEITAQGDEGTCNKVCTEKNSSHASSLAVPCAAMNLMAGGDESLNEWQRFLRLFGREWVRNLFDAVRLSLVGSVFIKKVRFSAARFVMSV